MALNTILQLRLNNVAVVGGNVQKAREGTIVVTSLDWSFDSDDNIGEVKFTAELDRETPVIGNGLKNDAVADALFDFYDLNKSTGAEVKIFTLHGTSGRVTSVNLWQMNNLDPNLARYAVTIQYTMSFTAIEQTWVATNTSVTIP